MTTINPNPIIKRIAVKGVCKFLTPALIGSGNDEYTDSDIIRDSAGNPFVPGSAVAGILRSYLHSNIPDKDHEYSIFGNGNETSPLWVYDSELENCNTVELDGVALNSEFKTAERGAKYDYEAVDTGATFTIRLLLNIRKKDKEKGYEDKLEELVYILKSCNLALGAKSNRGFGRFICENPTGKEFDFYKDKTTALDAWISFDWHDDQKWDDAKCKAFADPCHLMSIDLKLDGSIMIRDYKNIFANSSSKETLPDYRHITSGRKPVIFGTSWAGAFRSGLLKLLGNAYKDKADTYINKVFGQKIIIGSKDNPDITVSEVSFGASFLKQNGGTDSADKEIGHRSITRVKIDRFTGGAANSALFVEEPWFGGITTLEIKYPKNREDIKELLFLGICGIEHGLIQIGGEAAVGRGFFNVTDVKIDGKSVIDKVNLAKPELKSAISNMGEDKSSVRG